MTRSTIRIWFLIHKWTSLVSTLFLLLLCVTGLPLIFHDEIDAALGEDHEAALAGPPSAEGGLPLDAMLRTALAARSMASCRCSWPSARTARFSPLPPAPRLMRPKAR